MQINSGNLCHHGNCYTGHLLLCAFRSHRQLCPSWCCHDWSDETLSTLDTLPFQRHWLLLFQSKYITTIKIQKDDIFLLCLNLSQESGWAAAKSKLLREENRIQICVIFCGRLELLSNRRTKIETCVPLDRSDMLESKNVYPPVLSDLYVWPMLKAHWLCRCLCLGSKQYIFW